MNTNPTILNLYAEARMADAAPRLRRPRKAATRRWSFRLPHVVNLHYHPWRPAIGRG
jgi:hypothetical protein